MDEKSSRQRKTPEVDAGAADKPTAKAHTERTTGGDATLNPLESLMLRREVRIGMALLAVLALVLGFVFVSKISEQEENARNIADAGETDLDAAESDNPTSPPPTVVTASTHDTAPAASPNVTLAHRDQAYMGDTRRHDLAPPNPSYLPRRTPADEQLDARATPTQEQIPSRDASEAAPTDRAYDSSVATTVDGAEESKYGRYLNDDRIHDEHPADSHETSNPPETTTSDTAATATAPPNAIAHDASTGDRTYDRSPVQATPVKAHPAVEHPAESHPIHEQPVESVADSQHESAVEPVPPAAGPTPIETPLHRTYVTVEGDTPASIARAYYDAPRLAAALMAYNGVEIAADTLLSPGGEVLIPQRALLESEFARLIPDETASRSVEAIVDARPSPNAHAAPSATAHARPPATRIYEVARGETVYDIARRELGRVSRWREILQLNEEQLGGDIDAIEPGMKLVLPEEGRSSVARQRGELLWR